VCAAGVHRPIRGNPRAGTALQTHLTASGIAERLFVSSHTVKAEVKSIYRKLSVSSRHDAVQKAAAIGLLGA
jgi:LuxR family transcriptional regulator, maltose regulon positive regulatory protein